MLFFMCSPSVIVIVIALSMQKMIALCNSNCLVSACEVIL